MFGPLDVPYILQLLQIHMPKAPHVFNKMLLQQWSIAYDSVPYFFPNFSTVPYKGVPYKMK